MSSLMAPSCSSSDAVAAIAIAADAVADADAANSFSFSLLERYGTVGSRRSCTVAVRDMILRRRSCSTVPVVVVVQCVIK